MKIKNALLPLTCLLLAPAGCSSGIMSGNAAETANSLIPAKIQTIKGVVRLNVEIARTPEEQARGLMFRETLPADGGMLFPMSPPRYASFWMKNTIIPLDMIFIRPDGSIARIEPETIPHSLTPITSGEPVAAVLELGGGRAVALGIAEGDRVIWDDKGR
jgi:uncharacterized protein